MRWNSFSLFCFVFMNSITFINVLHLSTTNIIIRVIIFTIRIILHFVIKEILPFLYLSDTMSPVKNKQLKNKFIESSNIHTERLKKGKKYLLLTINTLSSLVFLIIIYPNIVTLLCTVDDIGLPSYSEYFSLSFI